MDILVGSLNVSFLCGVDVLWVCFIWGFGSRVYGVILVVLVLILGNGF